MFLNTTQLCVVGELREAKVDSSFLNDKPAPYNHTTLPTWEVALKISFYILAMLMDLVGNSIVILIVVLNRKMRTTTNTLIANLAISDLMVACFCMWVHAGNQVTPIWPFGNFFCKINTFFQVLSVTASVLTLMIIAVERFYAVVFPFKRHWSSLTTGLIIALAWIVAFCTAVPQLIVRKEHKNEWLDRTDSWCTEVWPEYYVDVECNREAPGKIAYYIVVGVVMYFLPILVMIFTYSIIALRLLSRRNPSRRPSGGNMSNQDRAKRKVTKMLIMVLLVFIVSWSPHQVIMLNDNLNPNAMSPEYMSTVRYVALFMAYTCSSINPILYAGFNENFRRGFVEAFRCILMQKRNRIDPDGSTTRSRATARHGNVNTEGVSVPHTIEHKELRELTNGLITADDRAGMETTELLEAPLDLDVDGNNSKSFLKHSTNGSSLPTVAVSDSGYKSSSEVVTAPRDQDVSESVDAFDQSNSACAAVTGCSEPTPASESHPSLTVSNSLSKLSEKTESDKGVTHFTDRLSISSLASTAASEASHSADPLTTNAPVDDPDLLANVDGSDSHSSPLLSSKSDCLLEYKL